MAYRRQTDPNHIEPQEDGYDHQQFHHANQCLPSNQVRLGFDELVEEINNEIPLCESDKEENPRFVPGAPNLGSNWPSIYGTHPRHLDEFTAQSPDISQLWHGKASAIGFNPAVLPMHQIINEGDSWRNSTEKRHGAEVPGSSALAPAPSSLENRNLRRQSGNEHHKGPVGFVGSIFPHYPSHSVDATPDSENKGSGGLNLVDPPLLSSKDSLPPRAQENASLDDTEQVGCPIQIVEVPQGSNKNLASFCNKVREIRASFPASDINSNSGKIWAITTAYPSQLFADTKFRVNVSTNNSAQTLHLLPQANYLVKDLIRETLLLCANEQLSPKECLLSVRGSEEFLQMDHCLGSHKIFQKSKSVLQLLLQKNSDVPGKLSRKSGDDHSLFHLNQLLEFTHIWKVSRQCLFTVIKKYDFQVKLLLKNQEDMVGKRLPAMFSSAPNPFQTHVNNVIEEVKNICSVLGCVETKQVSDAVKELKLLQRNQPQNFHQKSETSKKGFIEKVAAKLSRSIYQLIEVYCSSFCTDFQAVHLPGSTSCILAGLRSHLSFTVCALHNVPETWAHSYTAFSFSCWLTYAGKKLCQVESCRSTPATKSFFLLVNWNEIINFPLEIKSLPRESMLIIKVFGIDSATHSANLLAWTCLPLFPKEKSMLGSRLFSMTFQSEPPIEMIAPGVWDGSQPSPLTLQIDFPAAGWEYINPDSEEIGTDAEEPPRECLKHIARLSQKQTPLLLSGEKRRYLWFYRFYCDNENSSLPLVLGSAPGWDEGTVSEMHAILRRWTFSHPLEALGLLTSSFPDQDIREAAVQQLDNLLTDELFEYLPQLVQAVKFEWTLECPLVELLLRHSLQNIRVAHRLYCNLAFCPHSSCIPFSSGFHDPLIFFLLLINSSLLLWHTQHTHPNLYSTNGCYAQEFSSPSFFYFVEALEACRCHLPTHPPTPSRFGLTQHNLISYWLRVYLINAFTYISVCFIFGLTETWLQRLIFLQTLALGCHSPVLVSSNTEPHFITGELGTPNTENKALYFMILHTQLLAQNGRSGWGLLWVVDLPCCDTGSTVGARLPGVTLPHPSHSAGDVWLGFFFLGHLCFSLQWGCAARVCHSSPKLLCDKWSAVKGHSDCRWSCKSMSFGLRKLEGFYFPLMPRSSYPPRPPMMSLSGASLLTFSKILLISLPRPYSCLYQPNSVLMGDVILYICFSYCGWWKNLLLIVFCSSTSKRNIYTGHHPLTYEYGIIFITQRLHVMRSRMNVFRDVSYWLLTLLCGLPLRPTVCFCCFFFFFCIQHVTDRTYKILQKVLQRSWLESNCTGWPEGPYYLWFPSASGITGLLLDPTFYVYARDFQ
ncbi:Pik3c2g [Phodopus roborovskii]|uniref:Pik3c2g protein n=1 Tax=Phodopus roborovskii TaxID=109678 RepID=A0AAV0AC53_PHORO|nr:Pik3c2g [Phodopus roborovskii]